MLKPISRLGSFGFVYPFYPRFRAQWFRYNLADLPDLMVSTVVAMGGIEPPSILMLVAINPWLRVEGTTVGLTHPYPILTGDVSSLCMFMTGIR